MSTANKETTYTTEQISKALKMDENAILQYCKELPVRPKKDLRTGKAMFSSKDVDILKKAREAHAKGENLNAIAKRISNPNALTTRVANKGDIAVLIEAVAKSKELIIDDLSKIIDEKLEGMDEVVVELIKCKSENETLKQKARLISEENNQLKRELDSFEPLKFGFYRKAY